MRREGPWIPSVVELKGVGFGVAPRKGRVGSSGLQWSYSTNSRNRTAKFTVGGWVGTSLWLNRGSEMQNETKAGGRSRMRNVSSRGCGRHSQRRARVEEIAEDRVVVMFGDDLAVTAALNSRHDFRNIQIDPAAS
jgi:hypothetical protein